jgi:hypothetical protein
VSISGESGIHYFLWNILPVPVRVGVGNLTEFGGFLVLRILSGMLSSVTIGE